MSTLPTFKRITQACDLCHVRGRRCRPVPGDPVSSCSTCTDLGIVCTRTRVPSKRGPKPNRKPQSLSNRWSLTEAKHDSQQSLQILIDHFFALVYPIITCVHEASFRQWWADCQSSMSRSSYARLMAVCALTAHRINAGYTDSPSEPLSVTATSATMYLREAIAAIDALVEPCRDFLDMQAVALLCLTSLEIGDTSLLHKYLGYYHAISAEQGFHDEKRWPPNLSVIETEERRRLYWYMYRLEVHMALVVGHVIRCPELQSAVAYPGLPDDDLTGSPFEPTEWLSGWNYVTDLYRGLEHLVSKFRVTRMYAGIDSPRTSFSTFFLLDYDPEARIIEPLTARLGNLPPRFKYATKMSSNVGANRCSFQAANIICTYQLMKMVSYASSDTTVDQACQTALDLIEEITAIPIEYLRAMSLAMVQELSGFGHFLSNFIGKELTQREYLRLKTTMLCTSEFMESLDTRVPSSNSASSRLRYYVEKIDHVMNQHGPNNEAPSRTSQIKVRPETDFDVPIDAFHDPVDQHGFMSLGVQSHGELWDLGWIFGPSDFA